LGGDLTGNEVTAAARIAVTAVAAVPADSDPLALRPSGDACAHRVNDSGDFMSWDPRVLNAWPRSLLGHGIAVTDSTSLNLDAHVSNAGLRDFAFNNFKGSIRASDLHDTHL